MLLSTACRQPNLFAKTSCTSFSAVISKWDVGRTKLTSSFLKSFNEGQLMRQTVFDSVGVSD